VPGNTDAVAAFRTQATRHWYKALRRRSQRTRLTWERINRLAKRWLPPARVKHPFPEERFDARTQGRSPCGSPARWDLCGGAARKGGPYRDRQDG
jgi:RNA-directed DNA polymerase